MNSKIFFSRISIIICVLIFQSCMVIRNMMPMGPENWQDWTFNKVRETSYINDQIRRFPNNRIIGEIVYGDTLYPIYEIRVDNGAQKEVLILGGFHGDEPAGVFSSLEMAQMLSGENKHTEYNYRIVPLINPWGYEHDVRFNSDGLDINKDFADVNFMTQEAKLIIDEYGDLEPYIVIDNHEDNYQTDSYFFVYNSDTAIVMSSFAETHKKYDYNDQMDFHIYKARNGVVHIKKMILPLVRQADRWAVSNYFLKSTPRVVVIESAVIGRGMPERISFHIDSMEHILDYYDNNAH